MMLLPLLPLVVPLTTAVLAVALQRERRRQQAVALIGAAALSASCGTLLARVWTDGPLRVELGGWSAPFGIVVYADTLSASLTVATAIVHLAVTGYGLASADEDRRRSAFWPLVNTLVMGVQGAFLTGDIFNLYVWFEVLLISSFVLVAMGNTRPQIEASAKYVVLNLLSSTIFLSGVALLYGTTGTLNLADLSMALRDDGASPLISVIAVLFVVGFGIKAAMVPFSLWLPSAYGSPPPTLVSLLAALLTKVGVYAFLRTGALLFDGVVPWFDEALLYGAFASIVVGAVGAFAQTELRGAIVHAVVFGVGFMLLGVAVGTEAGAMGTIVYLLSDMIVVTALIMLSGEVERITGRSRLADMGGIYKHHPYLALGFLAVFLSVAGFPPMVGFWGKVALFDAMTASGRWAGMLVALAGSAVVLASVAQAWSLGAWRDAPAPLADSSFPLPRIAPIAFLVGVIAATSVAPGPLFELAERGARELQDVEGYQEGVLR
jgi:multicomponent Na+:H+ antiporter subunit D